MSQFLSFHAYDLLDHPELAAVELLVNAARVARITLAGRIDGLSFTDACEVHPDDPRKLIGHLLIDRCREIAEIATAYQQAGPPYQRRNRFDGGEEFPF